MIRLLASMNGKMYEQARKLNAIFDMTARQGCSTEPSPSPVSSGLRARLPCHSKHALRALDNEIGTDELLFRELVRLYS